MDARVGVAGLGAAAAGLIFLLANPAPAQVTEQPVRGGNPPVITIPEVSPPAAAPASLAERPRTPSGAVDASTANALAGDGADDRRPPPPAGPVAPPTPAHGASAVLRVLDKVTAETMLFEAPIGRRVRYKSLVLEVKVCVVRGGGEARPEPSAYLTVTSDAGASSGAALGPRQVFKGWMFATGPGLNALRHPVYDAWLVSCSAAAPAT